MTVPERQRRLSPWSGRVLLGDGLACYLGPGAGAARHAHHAVQLVSGSGGHVTVALDGQVSAVRAAIVPAGVPHALSASPDLLVVLLVEPLSWLGRTLGSAASRLADAELADRLPPSPRADAEPEALDGWLDRVVASVGVGLHADDHSPADCACHETRDEVRATLDYVAASLAGRPRLGEAAEVVGLSPTRLSHVFSHQVGVPFRRFVLWSRLKRVAGEVQRGRDLTAAAAAAGFADSAHLSRGCRAMLGVAPSMILPGAKLVDVSAGRPRPPRAA